MIGRIWLTLICVIYEWYKTSQSQTTYPSVPYTFGCHWKHCYILINVLVCIVTRLAPWTGHVIFSRHFRLVMTWPAGELGSTQIFAIQMHFIIFAFRESHLHEHGFNDVVWKTHSVDKEKQISNIWQKVCQQRASHVIAFSFIDSVSQFPALTADTVLGLADTWFVLAFDWFKREAISMIVTISS